MRDICLGLRDLHRRKIIHLDIKPDNVFISYSNKYKIGDLGLSRLVTKLEGNVPEGDSRYLAPELLNEDPAAIIPDLTKADIFSLGIMMYRLMSNKALPLNGEEWINIREGKINLEELKDFSNELKEVVLLMIQHDPSLRPSAEKILDAYLPSQEEMEIRDLKAENNKLKEEIENLKIKLGIKTSNLF